jgi:pimeloyl-ACP methyl ester carboxylesterase
MTYDASQLNYIAEGTGPPAILIHGNPATHSLWRPFVKRVADVRRTYAMDLPGFGGSPAPDDLGGYALEALAATVLRFADLRGIGRFDLVGHSFGGGIAITLAAMAPERVRTLAAITPLPDRAPPLANLLNLPLTERAALALWRTAPRRVRYGFSRRWTRVSYGAGYTADRGREVAAEAAGENTVRTMCRLMTSVDYTAYRAAMERVQAADMPLLLVGAGRDRVIPERLFADVRARMPRAACHIFPESGHVPMWQHADETAALVRAFWDPHIS